MSDLRLILASASPRRMELLDQLGILYTSDPANIDESRNDSETPSHYVQRMAREKAGAIIGCYSLSEYVVLGADTSVVVDGAVLGKPRDKDDALRILARLSGRTHSVLTAVYLLSAAKERCILVRTEVEFVTLSREICEGYLATSEPWDKAGAYGIQGVGGAFVRAIHGSYSNVVGLPLCETWQLLRESGIVTVLDTAVTA